MATRRTVVLACAAAALSACAPARRPIEPIDVQPAGASPTAPSSTAQSVPPTSAPSPSASPTAASSGSAPTLAEIQARFGASRPSQWGLQVSGVVTRTSSSAVALTFDACGGPGGTGYDERLIAALRRHRVPATLFLNARWVTANRALSAELAADPLFELGDHGSAHLPLSVSGRSAYGIPGTASVAAVYAEVMDNRARLEALAGRPVPWYRPGTAYFDEVAASLTRAVGLVPVNFSVNGDAGATFAPSQVTSAVSAVRAGDIVIGHMNRPGSGTAAGVEAALPALLERGVTFATLSGAGAAGA